MVGKILNGRYELLKSVGLGGMAEVYLAKDVLLDRKVAVKVLRKNLVHDQSQLAQFQREARSAARLIHPSIINIFDVCDEGDMSYIVMEYVEGVSLKAFEEQNGRLDPALAVALAAQLASALEHAHNHNIIHCDIKPQNIVLTESMVPKIVDFGISRIISNETMAFTASVVGSVHYFSPEQAQGIPVTAQSDIYSLGIVFYEMLTGHVPFDGSNAVAVARKQVEALPPPLAQFWEQAPAELQAIIDKALAKRLDERYSSAGVMKQDLLELKNRLYPSKNNHIFLDDTLPLQAVAAATAARNGEGGAGAPDGAIREEDTSLTQTLIMKLPDFLTKPAEDEVREAGNTGEPADGSAIVAGIPVGESESSGAVVESISPVVVEGSSGAEQAATAEAAASTSVASSAGMETAYTAGREAPAVSENSIVSEGAGEASGEDRPVAASATGDSGNGNGAVQTSNPDTVTELEEKPKKTGSLLFRLLKYAALILILLFGGLFYYFSSSRPDIAIPSVTGMTVAEAQKALEAKGFKVELEEVMDEKVSPGVVIRMDPVAGTKRKEGASITLVIARGLKLGVVPKLEGYTQEQAEKIIKGNKYKVGKISYKWDTKKPEGLVLAQLPTEKSKLDEGSAIDLVINKNNEKNVAVPDLKGLTLDEAKAKLAEEKLKLGTVKEVDSEEDKDVVTGMSPEQGMSVNEGSTVDIQVSNGSKKVTANSDGKVNSSVSVNRSTGSRYVEFVIPGEGTHQVQIISSTGSAQKVEVAGSYPGGARLRTKVEGDVRKVGFYVDNRLVEEKRW